MPRFSRSRRRGQRRRNRILYKKYVNLKTYGGNYKQATDSYAYQDIGPNIDSREPSTIFAGSYWIAPSFYDIYQNLNAGQQDEWNACAQLYSFRKLCAIKVTLSPLVTDVFQGTGNPSDTTNDGRLGPANRYLMIPCFEDPNNLTHVSTTGDQTRVYQDMPGARSFRMDQTGSIFVRPRVNKVGLSNVVPGGNQGLLNQIVAYGTERSGWQVITSDGIGNIAQLNLMRQLGIIIAFPAQTGAIHFMMTITLYVAYKGNV